MAVVWRVASASGGQDFGLSGRDPAGERLKGELVAVDPATDDHSGRDGRNVGVMPKAFTRVNVGDVDFDDRHVGGLDRVHNGDRGMRIGARVQDDPLRGGAGLLDPVDQIALVVGLPQLDFEAKTSGDGAGPGLDVAKRRRAIDRRLPQAEQVQVRSVEDEDDGFQGSARSSLRVARATKDPRAECAALIGKAAR